MKQIRIINKVVCVKSECIIIMKSSIKHNYIQDYCIEDIKLLITMGNCTYTCTYMYILV